MRYDLYPGLIAKTKKLSLTGLGYVGMPIAVAFAKKIRGTLLSQGIQIAPLQP